MHTIVFVVLLTGNRKGFIPQQNEVSQFKNRPRPHKSVLTPALFPVPSKQADNSKPSRHHDQGTGDDQSGDVDVGDVYLVCRRDLSGYEFVDGPDGQRWTNEPQQLSRAYTMCLG